MAGKKEAPKPTAPEAEGEGEGGAPTKKKLAGKTLILFIVLPAILILGGGGAAAFMLLSKPAAEQHADASGHGEEKKAKKEKKEKKEEKGGGHGKDGKDGKDGKGGGGAVVTEGDGVYYMALPELLVNVSTADGRPAFLKLKLTLEASDEDVISAVEPELPRVMDQFQSFLRELRVDDLSGSAGSYRLRLELLRRVNLAVAPAQVNAVLIEEMLVQ
jgi:flagellar FliL protein